MSGFTIGVAMLGGLVLASLVGYNTWTSRRNAPRQPETPPRDPAQPIEPDLRQGPLLDPEPPLPIPERKPGLEEIVLPDRPEPLRLPPDHPGFLLLQQIRDEAHRFAIQGHRARRGKARTTSSLQAIGGIGAARRRALLAHFGGLKGVQAASIEDLARVPGISRALAERIFAELH